MIDWLRDEMQAPQIELNGRALPIAIRRHPRANRLTMRLAPDGSEVRITLPRWGRTRDALVFVQKRTDWLEKQLAAVPERKPPAPGETIQYRGSDLIIGWDQALPRKPQLVDGRLNLGGARETLERRVGRWLESEALTLFSEDLAQYCEIAGQPIPNLRLSRAQRRWGSCSGRDRASPCIRINWRLVQAPDHVRRSVVAHEVAHLAHFDHSPAFHALLGSIYEGDLQAADGWLKREGRKLYASFG